MANTEHYQQERQFREDFIQEVIGGYGDILYQGYTLNKDRNWLSEVHRVYSNGIITIINPFRGKDRIVTTKIARPGQVRFVYSLPRFIKIENNRVITEDNNENAPFEIIRLCEFYLESMWNHDFFLPEREEWNSHKDRLNQFKSVKIRVCGDKNE